jgi:hypothetical protein
MACLVCHSRTSNWSHVRRRRDITELVKLESEQKKTIDALYQNEEKLRLILENIKKVSSLLMLIKIILANYIANEMLEFKRAMKCLII